MTGHESRETEVAAFFVVGAENGETNKIGVIANNDNRKAFFSCWNTGFFSFFVGSEFHMNGST